MLYRLELELELELVSKLSVTHSQTGLAVNDEKCKYVFMFPEQNAGQNHNVTTGNKIFMSVSNFRIFSNDRYKSE